LSAGEFGAQAVVLAIDAKREGNHWDVRGAAEGGIPRDWMRWNGRGAEWRRVLGKILLTSMDKDGTQSG